ncbi:hypothetical protein AB5J56_40160 [Streptomyces sp. R21]|uniref:Transposase n=1 Tax=Streptomyces sp. R21 TaxID=3238627 RepID=A0AB39PNG1_9ACTN
MKLVVQVKLLPTPVQTAALEATLRACNEAASWVSSVAFEKDVKRNFALREPTYGQVKERCAGRSQPPLSHPRNPAVGQDANAAPPPVAPVEQTPGL